MQHAILLELVVVMAVAVASAALLRRLQLPPVVGFIIAGTFVGPGGFGLVKDRHQIELVAEVGVMLLLFTVGLKLRLADLWQLRRSVFGGGALQVVVTGGVTLAAALILGRPLPEAVVWGAMVALSSTALVLWLLEASGDTGTRHGRMMISVLLFQDLAVVPVMLALPLLAGHAATATEIGLLLGRSLAVIALTIVGARYAFPFITARIVASGSQELFTLTTVLAAVGTALVFGHFGLSMALGAFLAGMVVSESEYVGRMIDHVTPLRDVFNSLFFVSMGMLVEPRLWMENPLPLAAMLVGVLALKALVAGLVSWLIERNTLTAMAAGLGLSQIGEFSVVVASEAARLGLLPEAQHQLFLAIAVPTVVVTPLLLRMATQRLRDAPAQAPTPMAGLDEHVIVVGYGINGRSVGRALDLLEVPYVVVDLNAQTITDVVGEGGMALEGDAAEDAVLQSVGIERARAVVATLSSATATRGVVAAARRLNAATHIIARTRYLREVEPLRELGATVVVPEEYETALELTGRVLSLYGAAPHVIAREKDTLRREGYELLREDGVVPAPHPTIETLRQLATIAQAQVGAQSDAAGRSLRELNLRGRTGATVLAIERDGRIDLDPPADYQLQAGDTLVTFANGPALAAVRAMLSAPQG